MDLNAIKVFVHVVDAGSFVAAAEQTGIPKSTIARRIDELEASLGARLLQRSTRRSELTELGGGFYERARQIVADVDDAVEDVRAKQTEPRGVLRFTTSVLLAERYLGPIVAEYLGVHPRVELDMYLSPKHFDVIADGFDLALRVGPLKASSYIVRRLAPAPAYLCASPTYLKKRSAPTSVDELQKHDAIVFSASRSRETWRLDNDRGDQVNVVMDGPLVVNSHPIAMDCCLAGLGLAELPALVCCDALRSGELVRVLPKWSNASRWLHALYPSRHHVSPKVRTFLDFIAERLDPAPWDLEHPV
ncbi:MAG: LysR family transcriptional regulator [Myxococcota bacterium]